MLWLNRPDSKTAAWQIGQHRTLFRAPPSPPDRNSMNLTWTPSASASSLYAVWRLRQGPPLLSADLASALEEPAEALLNAMEVAGAEPNRTLQWLVALSANIESNQQLAEQALTRVLGRTKASSQAPRLIGPLTTLEHVFERQMPSLPDDLRLREQPLRMQWEAHGPGLLYTLARAAEPELLVSDAQVVLVTPVSGGGGVPHPLLNQVTFEAVVTDVVPQLPEILRLAWLLAHLNLDLPRYGERLPHQQRETVGSLALIPLVLFSAERLELAACDKAHFRAAIKAWLPHDASLAERVDTLHAWWEVYLDSRPTIEAGLLALAHMLADSP